MRDLDFSNMEELGRLIGCYKQVFAGEPWNDTWSSSEVRPIILEAKKQNEFRGSVLDLKDNMLGGFGFGYRPPKTDLKTNNFQKVYQELEKIGWENTFYLAEFGLVSEFQNKGLGRKVLKSLVKGEDKLVLRTLNDKMLSVASKVYGVKACVLFQDPVKPNRNWYGFER